jgi:hypothetical protein
MDVTALENEVLRIAQEIEQIGRSLEAAGIHPLVSIGRAKALRALVAVSKRSRERLEDKSKKSRETRLKAPPSRPATARHEARAGPFTPARWASSRRPVDLLIGLFSPPQVNHWPRVGSRAVLRGSRGGRWLT